MHSCWVTFQLCSRYFVTSNNFLCSACIIRVWFGNPPDKLPIASELLSNTLTIVFVQCVGCSRSTVPMPMAHQFCRHTSTVLKIVPLCALPRIQLARQQSSRQRVTPVTVIQIPTMDSQIHAAHDTNIHATVSGCHCLHRL